MMKSLMGLINSVDASIVQKKTDLRFKCKFDFVTPEALICYEQKLLPPDRLFEAVQREYNMVLDCPKVNYVSRDFLQQFSKFKVIVIDYDVSGNAVTLGTIPEFKDEFKKIFIDGISIKTVLIPIYMYVEYYTRQQQEPDFLYELPTRDKWDFIVSEALELGASDITLSKSRSTALVYYNVRKKKVPSRRSLKLQDVDNIVKLLASSANATLADESARPRYFSIDINQNNRGRVVVNKTYYGLLMTIRILPNSTLNKTLEQLRIEPSTCEFIRETMLSPEKGLRLFIGETMSGKNTTILCALLELVRKSIYKIVSLEQPVEILVDGIEQINAESDEEFELNADSLLRQNPDIVYFTEITARTAKSIMQQCNTSKAVFSTIHANSIADVLSRLQDITQMPIDRIILTLHSCVYQELVRDERTDTVKPYNRCVYFSDDLKSALYGKPLAQIIGILQGEERRWK